MLRRALLVTPILLLGCASPRTSPLIVGDAANFSWTEAPHVEALVGPGDAANISGTEAPPVEALAGPVAATWDFSDFAPDSQMPPAPPPPRQRFSIKGGYYGSSEDGIDDGYIINLTWKRPTSGRLSSEVEIGYLDASGDDNGVDRDVWAIPLMVNGRFDVPVGQKIEIYGGLGLGTFYYDVEAKAGPVKASTDGFLLAGDAFFGGAIHLARDLSLGLEGKYYVTDNTSDLGGGLDAYVVLLTLGFDR